MSTWLVVVAAVAAGALVILWHYGKRPYRYRSVHTRDLQRFFSTLLNRGYQGGLLILETGRNKGDSRFLQFSKYIREEGPAGLEFGFPLAPWSRPWYDVLRRKLEADGVRFELQSTGRQDTTQFLVVDFASDLTMAQRVAELAVGVVFGEGDPSFEAHYENVSPLDVTIRH
jgi:hypothetical protein